MGQTDFASPERIEAERKKLFAHFREFPFFKLLGMELLDVEPHRARLALDWRNDLTQPAGIMHGGVIASLVDTAFAQSISLTPAFQEARAAGALIVSVDLRIKYLRPISSGRIICDAHAPRIGRTITHCTATVTDSAGKEVATGDSIYMLVREGQIRKR